MHMNKLVWTVDATYHDWREHSFFMEFMSEAMRLHLIGTVEWIEREIDSDREPLSLDISEDLPKKLVEKYFKGDEVDCLTLGGYTPSSWDLVYSAFGYNFDSGIMRAVNCIMFTFDKSAINSEYRSQSLMKSFCKLHRQENTEYAKIHPYSHWNDLDDRDYEISVTNLMHGIYWANYLAPGHIHLFDKEKLNAVDPWKILKKDDNELCFITSPNLNLADSRESEIEIVRLTKLFKAALIDTE